MAILGITCSHNSSVAIVDKGQVLFAWQEERPTRVKNQGGLPYRSLEAALRFAREQGLAIDQVAVADPMSKATTGWLNRDTVMGAYSSRFQRAYGHQPQGARHVGHLRPWLRYARRGARRLLLRPNGNAAGQDFGLAGKWDARDPYRVVPAYTLQELGRLVPGCEPRWVYHHHCHAAAAYGSGGATPESTLVLTCDGGGDGLCAAVGIGSGSSLRILEELPSPNSLGSIMSAATYLMGMVPLEYEYKVMGLAPYGDSAGSQALCDQLLEYVDWPEGGTLWRLRPPLLPTYLSYPVLSKLFERQRFDVVASGLQLFLERVICQWVRRAIGKYRIGKLRLGGGVFMNVKMNKAIAELPEVEDVWLMPSCGDDSNSIGAALALSLAQGDPPRRLEHLYLGPELPRSAADLEKRVGGEFKVTKPDSIEEVVARLCAQGEIVARSCGREEFGARALGHRSILADPSRLEVVPRLNKAVKSRDFWMPFAPSMTTRQHDEVLVNPKGVSGEFMMMSFDVKDKYEQLQSATHPYDHSVRPQVLRDGVDDSYGQIIRRFSELTDKHAGILNTSFNLHGFPIVSSLEDGLEVLRNSELRYLAYEDYLIESTR